MPVIKNADQKNIAGLAREIDDLARKTREGKLTLADMQGGTFTVNNTGSFGSILSYPIINYPQAAIVTFESIVKRPVVINDMIAVRSMANICLSLDHRILDGVICGRFLQRVKENLEGFNIETRNCIEERGEPAGERTNVKAIDVRYTPMIGLCGSWELQKACVKQIDKEERQRDAAPSSASADVYDRFAEASRAFALSEEELAERGIGVFQIDRGGDITYHGPGQLVGYPLLYLDGAALGFASVICGNWSRSSSIGWANYGIEGGRKPEYTGVWVGDEKIAAIGVKFNKARTRRGFVTSHGFALNVKAGIAQDGFRGHHPMRHSGLCGHFFCGLNGHTSNRGAGCAELLPSFLQAIRLRDRRHGERTIRKSSRCR